MIKRQRLYEYLLLIFFINISCNLVYAAAGKETQLIKAIENKLDSLKVIRFSADVFIKTAYFNTAPLMQEGKKIKNARFKWKYTLQKPCHFKSEIILDALRGKIVTIYNGEYLKVHRLQRNIVYQKKMTPEQFRDNSHDVLSELLDIWRNPLTGSFSVSVLSQTRKIVQLKLVPLKKNSFYNFLHISFLKNNLLPLRADIFSGDEQKTGTIVFNKIVSDPDLHDDSFRLKTNHQTRIITLH